MSKKTETEIKDSPAWRTIDRAEVANRLLQAETELAELQTKIEEEKRAPLASESRQIRELEGDVRDLREQVANVDRYQAALAAVPRVGDSGIPYGSLGRTNGPVTYRKAAEGGQFSYFKDLVGRAVYSDSDAAERLARHAQEVRAERPGLAIERRDISIGGAADFIPPIYLADQWAPLARASRPLADAIGPKPLPDSGDTLTVPKVSGGTTVAMQATEADAVSETNATKTSVTFGVKTAAGQQDLSLQLFERASPGFDEVIAQDLAAALATQVDNQVINGSDASGQVEGIRLADSINTVTYTEATPTAGMLYAKVAEGISKIHAARFLSPTLIAMAPRRWSFILSQRDTTGRPLVVEGSEGRTNAMAAFPGVAAEAMVGTMQGIPVLADGSIPLNLGAATNEDLVFVLRTPDLLLYESTPRIRVFPDVLSGTLQVRLQAVEYLAFSAERYPTSVTMISGTGLVVPAFS
jgi:HK97 family phage major capsid protein